MHSSNMITIGYEKSSFNDKFSWIGYKLYNR